MLLKNKQKELILFVILILILVFSIQLGLFDRTPIILSAAPTAIYQEYPETWEVTLEGSGFSKGMELYLEDNRLREFLLTDDGTVAFTIPEQYAEIGPITVQLQSKAGKKSNRFLLQIESKPRPTIDEILVESETKVSQILKIKASNLPQDCIIQVNGITQEAVSKVDDTTFLLKLSTPQFALEDTLDIQIVDANDFDIYGPSFSLQNKYRHDESKIFKGSTEYLKNGYLVAHAMGVYNNKETYTSSLEAFQASYQVGHRIFEVDFQFTADNVLATLHDREGRIDTFENEQNAVEYTILSFEDLCRLMEEYPDVYIVTDTKYHMDFEATAATLDTMTKIIEEQNPELFQRFVIQVYNQAMYYFLIDNYPFVSYIYTLYASSDTNAEVLDFVEKERIQAVTMWGTRASREFVQELNALGAYAFVHTINEPKVINNFMAAGVYGIYTDSVTYSDLPVERQERFSLPQQDFLEQLAVRQFIQQNAPDTVSVLQANAVSPESADRLAALGIRWPTSENGDMNYLAIKKGSDVLYADASPEEVDFSWSDAGTAYFAGSNFSDVAAPSSFLVNGVEYAVQRLGSSYICYSYSADTLETVVFSPDDSIAQTAIGTEFIQNRVAFQNYLAQLIALQEDYIIVLAAQDDASSLITEAIQQQLYGLGLTVPLQGAWRNSYLSVIDGGKVIYEESSLKLLQTDAVLENVFLSAESSGYANGAYCSITINGREYAGNSRGLNIVLYHKPTGLVVDSVVFDTCGDLKKTNVLYPDLENSEDTAE